MAAGNEARSASEREVIPYPLKKDGEAVAESDEKCDVDGQPGGQAMKPLHCALNGHSIFGYGGEASDGRHVALIEIAEGGAWLAIQVLLDHFGDMSAHLHGGLRYSWNLFTVLFDVGQVSADEDIRMTGWIERLVDTTAAASSVSKPTACRDGDAATPAAHL